MTKYKNNNKIYILVFLLPILQLIGNYKLTAQNILKESILQIKIDSVKVSTNGDTISYCAYNHFNFGNIYNQTINSSLNQSGEIKKKVPEGPIAKSGDENGIKPSIHLLSSIDKSKYVGKIPYIQGSTPTGGLSYNIPIEAASSLGLSPKISLTYNSQSGNGVAGMGWDLAGLSAITITNKNIYFDQEVSPVRMYDSGIESNDSERGHDRGGRGTNRGGSNDSGGGTYRGGKEEEELIEEDLMTQGVDLLKIIPLFYWMGIG